MLHIGFVRVSIAREEFETFICNSFQGGSHEVPILLFSIPHILGTYKAIGAAHAHEVCHEVNLVTKGRWSEMLISQSHKLEN